LTRIQEEAGYQPPYYNETAPTMMARKAGVCA